MKVKFSIISFIPAVIAMLILRVMSVIGVDESGNFLGMDRMALSYTTIGIALALFIVCIIINIFDRKTAPVYPVKKNFAAGVFAILSGLAVIASSCMSLVEITTESEYFMMGVISAIFSVPAGLAFLIMSKVHFTGKSTVSGVSILYVFPALWGCTELVFEFLNATKVSISATDLTGLFCYIFITLYYFSHSMVVWRIKGRNPVKACFIYGLPAVALTLSHGVYMIITTMHEGISNIPFITAAMFIVLGLYALSFIIEMFVNSYTKDELEVVESLPEPDNTEEEEKYIDTEGYDDLVFSNSSSSTEPNVDPSDDYYSSAKGMDDFIIGFNPEQKPAEKTEVEAEPEKPKKKKKGFFSKKQDEAPAGEAAQPEVKETAEEVKEDVVKEEKTETEPVVTEPEIEEPVVTEPEISEPVTAKHFAPEPKPEPKAKAEKPSQTSELEEELRRLSEKKIEDTADIEIPETPVERVKTTEDAEQEAKEKARLSEIDKLLQELDNKSE